MRLAYGWQSGFGRYGPRPVSQSGMDRGARIIELTMGESGNNSTTYICNVRGGGELPGAWLLLLQLQLQLQLLRLLPAGP